MSSSVEAELRRHQISSRLGQIQLQRQAEGKRQEKEKVDIEARLRQLQEERKQRHERAILRHNQLMQQLQIQHPVTSLSSSSLLTPSSSLSGPFIPVLTPSHHRLEAEKARFLAMMQQQYPAFASSSSESLLAQKQSIWNEEYEKEKAKMEVLKQQQLYATMTRQQASPLHAHTRLQQNQPQKHSHHQAQHYRPSSSHPHLQSVHSIPSHDLPQATHISTNIVSSSSPASNRPITPPSLTSAELAKSAYAASQLRRQHHEEEKKKDKEWKRLQDRKQREELEELKEEAEQELLKMRRRREEREWKETRERRERMERRAQTELETDRQLRNKYEAERKGVEWSEDQKLSEEEDKIELQLKQLEAEEKRLWNERSSGAAAEAKGSQFHEVVEGKSREAQPNTNPAYDRNVAEPRTAATPAAPVQSTQPPQPQHLDPSPPRQAVPASLSSMAKSLSNQPVVEEEDEKDEKEASDGEEADDESEEEDGPAIGILSPMMKRPQSIPRSAPKRVSAVATSPTSAALDQANIEKKRLEEFEDKRLKDAAAASAAAAEEVRKARMEAEAQSEAAAKAKAKALAEAQAQAQARAEAEAQAQRAVKAAEAEAKRKTDEEMQASAKPSVVPATATEASSAKKKGKGIFASVLSLSFLKKGSKKGVQQAKDGEKASPTPGVSPVQPVSGGGQSGSPSKEASNSDSEPELQQPPSRSRPTSIVKSASKPPIASPASIALPSPATPLATLATSAPSTKPSDGVGEDDSDSEPEMQPKQISRAASLPPLGMNSSMLKKKPLSSSSLMRPSTASSSAGAGRGGGIKSWNRDFMDLGGDDIEVEKAAEARAAGRGDDDEFDM